MVVVLALLPAALATPWTLEASGAFVGVGFAPSANGAGVSAAGLATLAGTDRAALALGPRLDVDHTALLGTWLAASSALEGRFRPVQPLVVDLRLSLGLQQAFPAGPAWTFDGPSPDPARRYAAPAGRVALAAGVGVDLLAGPVRLRPMLRYEQALFVGFAPRAGLPLMASARVMLGLAIDLPVRSGE